MRDSEQLYRLIDASIRLEHNMAALYEKMAEVFPQDKQFCWTLVMEEKNHAALLRSGRQSFMPHQVFPLDLIPSSLSQLKQSNQMISEFIKQLKNHQSSRKEAFNKAYSFEESAGEFHFQTFMDKPVENDMERMFKELNQGDKDHALRIKRYMEEQDIPFLAHK
ncbi:MAG: hypothetical protein KGY60_02155 [Bacteroidales bacterium]|nr:hypothetical protein [Bacteroidales bacterium]